MKTIKIEDYFENMGTLIRLDNELDTAPKHSVYLSVDKILNNPMKYLNKGEEYYFICKKGVKSRRVVQILSIYGFSVYKVIF